MNDPRVKQEPSSPPSQEGKFFLLALVASIFCCSPIALILIWMSRSLPRRQKWIFSAIAISFSIFFWAFAAASRHTAQDSSQNVSSSNSDPSENSTPYQRTENLLASLESLLLQMRQLTEANLDSTGSSSGFPELRRLNIEATKIVGETQSFTDGQNGSESEYDNQAGSIGCPLLRGAVFVQTAGTLMSTAIDQHSIGQFNQSADLAESSLAEARKALQDSSEPSDRSPTAKAPISKEKASVAKERERPFKRSQADYQFIFDGQNFTRVNGTRIRDLSDMIRCIYRGQISIDEASSYLFRIEAVTARVVSVTEKYVIYEADIEGDSYLFAIQRDPAFEADKGDLSQYYDDLIHTGQKCFWGPIQDGPTQVVGEEQFRTESGDVKSMPVVSVVNLQP